MEMFGNSVLVTELCYLLGVVLCVGQTDTVVEYEISTFVVARTNQYHQEIQLIETAIDVIECSRIIAIYITACV